MALKKGKGPKLYFSQLGGEQPIPPEFIAAMERKQESQPVPDDVGPEALSDLIVESKLETNRTDERIRTSVKKKSGNITLSAVRTNDQGQPVQVTLTMFPTGTVPDAPSATKSVAVHDLGNGWSIQESSVEGSYVAGVFTPGVLANNRFERELPNLTPEEFRPSIPTVTTRTDSAGTAIDPTLSGTEFRESQEQITEFKKRVEISTQEDPVLPVTLDKGRDTNQAKQDVTVTRSLVADSDTPAVATALKDVRIQQLGNGAKVQETREISAVFGATVYSAERRRILPDLFFVGITDTTVEQTAIGVAAAPTLTSSQLRASEQQVDTFNKRTSTTTAGTVANTTSFTGKEWTDQFGGAVIDHVQHKEAANTLTTDFHTVAARSEPLGDGTYFVDERKLPSGNWPTLGEDIWDELAQSFVHVTKQVVATGSTSPGYTSGVLTEVHPIDSLHELKVTSTYSSLPSDVALPVIVEVSTPNWFTSGPTQIDASSGYTADRGESYAVKSKQGHFIASLKRKFSITVPAAPAGTLLVFQPIASQADEAYENVGDEPYCRILRYSIPEHIASEPTGDFIVSLQTQFHRCSWVQEYVVVTL